ncbi:hypothetical protein HPP92_005822 [Vanilla planifolia]|uniref:Uncharacterized protein n=1 Tax=Vanilla planifolia TaxID=51239 RepID=A0A835VF33_VANPL|nr:hypothetical protein HPP92_005822 [Vanilla planifolia]
MQSTSSAISSQAQKTLEAQYTKEWHQLSATVECNSHEKILYRALLAISLLTYLLLESIAQAPEQPPFDKHVANPLLQFQKSDGMGSLRTEIIPQADNALSRRKIPKRTATLLTPQHRQCARISSKHFSYRPQDEIRSRTISNPPFL